MTPKDHIEAANEAAQVLLTHKLSNQSKIAIKRHLLQHLLKSFHGVNYVW
jgi:hypothetical protein